MLNKRFERLYEAYLNNWSDSPIIVTVILTLGSKISYNPSMELIKTAIFDHFIHENIYTTIYKKSFIDPQEFPQYMICFEEVFEISVDQNSILNGRVKESDEFNFYYKSIKKNFDNCYKALNKCANELTPILTTYVDNSKINFVQLEKNATHKELKDLIVELKEEDVKVRKLKQKLNIGLFEFQLDYLLDQVVLEPRKLLKKIFLLIPNIMIRKTKSLNEKVENYYKKIMNTPNDVENFIILKKACEECTLVRNEIDEEEDEINELINITHNYKEIRLQDYDKKSISELKLLKNKFERRYDSVVYFIDNNIKQFRMDLMKKIKEFDDKIKSLINELNDEIINNFHEDTIGPILFLEDKSLQIQRAIENKKIYQQQEIDIEMDESNKSNFENLDELTYLYDLKIKIWKNISEFQDLKKKFDETQVLNLEVESSAILIQKWINICKVSLIDLDNSNVPKEFLDRVLVYEKIVEIIKIIQNENIQKVDELREMLRIILGIHFDFSENFFTVGRLLQMENIFNLLDDLRKLNLRANEEHRIKTIFKNKLEEFNTHHIPLQLKVDNEKGSQKFIILYEDFDNEYEFIENNLLILNKELLNKYVSVVEKDLRKLINNFNKYEIFLNSFYDYQTYMLKCESLLFNTEFPKEMPTEYKKLLSESMTKNLTKALKDSVILNKYVENSHERIMNYLSNLINNYELNYKAIFIYLERKRKEFQGYYLISNEDLLNIFQFKENIEIREKLLLKFFPFIKEIKPGNENEEFLKLKTYFFNEKLNIKYTKTTRTFKDDIETFEQGITKRLKEQFKIFRRELDASQKPKSKKKPFDVIIDSINNKDNIAQGIFHCVYYSIYDSLEKSLINEEEAFDKLFDLYHENKNGKKEEYIKLLKNKDSNDLQRKICICLIALENYFISIIENLIREDVANTNDYCFQSIISIKLDNDQINIKLLNNTFEYGNEYVGLENNFYFLPQTEKIFISIFNVLTLKKPFLIFNNQHILKHETLSIISNILGKYINYFQCNENFNLNGINNLIYGYMRNGNWFCLENVNVIKNEFLNTISDRIMEVYRNIQNYVEEGIYIENSNERYIINEKFFNIFMSYNIDYLGRKNNKDIPINIKEYFRNIGMNNINIDIYLRLILKNYAIKNSEEISSKILFIIRDLCKSNLFNTKGLREKMELAFIKKIKYFIMDNIKLIKRKTINQILKKGLIEIFTPFLKFNENEKNSIENNINMIFCDFEEETPSDKNEKNTSNKKETNEKKEFIPEKLIFEYLDVTLEKELNKFHFQNEEYSIKIKDLYFNFKNFKSFILIGPVLTGKTNILVTLRDFSLKLNHYDNEKYPIFDYVKIFHNSMSPESLFYDNNIKVSHQISNYYFKNFLDLLIDGSDYELYEIANHYKLMNLAPGAKLNCDTNKIKNKRRKSSVRIEEKTSSENEEEEKEKKNEDKKKEEEDDKININNKIDENIEKKDNENQKIKEEINEEKSSESHINSNQNPNEINNNNNENIIEESKKIKSLIFDGSISLNWYSILTNIYDNFSQFTFSDSDKLKLTDIKFIYETNSLNQASPSFITQQNIFSFNSVIFSWLNIAYAFVETNEKINLNDELKNYIKGLFENYVTPIIDFIEINKIKCLNFCINENFIITNLIRIFNSFLPIFDFTDNKIGRRNYNYIPKIDIIKKQTLNIFIFSCAWTMNFLTNFLIKTKIEKVISDLFKSDDLKGPILDYNLSEENFEFVLWNNIIQDEKYLPPTFQKNFVYKYNVNFITTNDFLPYEIIIRKCILNQVPIFLIGKPCSGKSFLIKYIINELDKSKSYIKSLSYNMTYLTKSNEIENFINNHLDIIKRKYLGDKFGRKNIVYIDDVHINKNSNQINEYFRKFLSEKCCYDIKLNSMKYYSDVNLINIGNYYNYTSYENKYFDDNSNNKLDFIRYMNRFNLITLNIISNNFSHIYKPTFEYFLRHFIPNTSNITANQYLQVEFLLIENLQKNIIHSYNNLHYTFNLRDITNVIQRFHMFIFRGTNEYPEYLKKIFFYENYCNYTDQMINDDDIKIFKKKICEVYSFIFKQDKTDETIFEQIDNDSNFIFGKNFIDVYEENKENNFIPVKDLEHVFISQKSDFKNFVKKKIEKYYLDSYLNGGGKNSENRNFVIHDTNDKLINYIIRILRLFENDYHNLILIGNKNSGKEVLLKIALYIYQIPYIEVEIRDLILNGVYSFINKTIIKILTECVYNNRKMYLICQNDIFENLNHEEQLIILESISKLLNPSMAIDSFNNFIDEKNFAKIELKEIENRITNNLNIYIGISQNTEIYRIMFTYYPFIVNNSNILYIEDNNKEYIESISNNVFKKFEIDESLNQIMIQIHEKAKELYDEFSKKIKIDLYANEKNYMFMCEFILKNYTNYKEILIQKQKNYEYSQNIVEKCNEVINELNDNIQKIAPKKETFEKLEANKKRINELNQEKAILKGKKNDEEKPLNMTIHELNIKQNEINDILQPFKDSIKKQSNFLYKLADKDILEIKNTWESFTFGKYLLSKVYECLKDTNGNDYDYVKKTIEVKTFREFIKINYSVSPDFLVKITKEVLNNTEFNVNEKFNKPFKLAGTICDYFISLNKYFDIYSSQEENLNIISELNEKINKHKEIIQNLNENYKKLDLQISIIEKEMANDEILRNNIQNQIDKIQSVEKEMKDFVNESIKYNEIWKNNLNNITSIINFFDYYMIYISAYITYAPIFSKSYRKKFQKFIYALFEESLTDKQLNETIKYFDFVPLITNFLDETNNDKILCTSMKIFEEFIQENFIFMNILNDKEVFIIDYYNIAKELISSYLEFSKMKSFVNIQYNNSNNEFKEKLEKAIKIGQVFFIENVSEINEIYYYFFDYINHRLLGDKYKKYLIFENNKLEINEEFKMYILKNNINESNMKIDSDIFSNMLIINFNFNRNEIKWNLFDKISKSDEEKIFTFYKKQKNELIKENSRKKELELKMIDSIIKMDLSGNIEKIENIQNINDKYKTDCFAYENSNEKIKQLEKVNNQRKINLAKKFNVITSDTAIIYKWISRFFILNNLYIIKLEDFAQMMIEFFKMKKKKKQLEEKKVEINNDSEEEEIEENKKNNEDNLNNDNENEENENEELMINYGNEYIYDKEDSKELILFIYDKIKRIYLNKKDKITLKIVFLLIYLNINRKIGSDFKNFFYVIQYLLNNKKDIENEKNEIICPNSVINNEDWNVLKKINEYCNFIFNPIINNIEENPSFWKEYLSEDNDIIKKSENHYLNNYFNFPSNIESLINPLIKLLFFYIIKPFRSEIFIEKILNENLFEEENKSLNCSMDLIKVFHEFNINDYCAILLIAPKNNLNYYDKLLHDYCFNKLIVKPNSNQVNVNNSQSQNPQTSNIEIKFKEIILNHSNEINTQDMEFIHSYMKSGGVIIIKNINLSKVSFVNLFDDISVMKKEEISPLFRLILVACDNIIVWSNKIYNKCLIIDYFSDLNYNSIKKQIMYYVEKLPIEYFDNLINSPLIYLRNLIRRFVCYYIICFGLIKVHKFKNPFTYELKDLINICKYIEKFIENNNLTEEKYVLFMNPENIIGTNYIYFISLLNDIFIFGKQFDDDELFLLKKYVNKIINLKYFINEDYYFLSEKIQILRKENEEDITFNEFYNYFNLYSNQDYESLIPNKTKEEKEQIQINNITNIMNNFVYLLKGQLNKESEREKIVNFNIKKIHNNILKLHEKLPEKIKYLYNYDNPNSEENEIIDPSLFKCNKFGFYNNSLDESLLFEIKYYNNYLSFLDNEILIILNMTNGNLHYNEYYYDYFKQINEDYIPYQLNIFSLKNEKLKIDDFYHILNNRIEVIRNWIKKGSLEVIPLNIFTNISLFKHCLKIMFCKKYFGENNYSKITPEMIKLKFNLTKYRNSTELNEDENGKKNIIINHNNEVIFVDGLFLQNAFIDEKNKNIEISNQKNKKYKLNIIVISYSIIKYKEENLNSKEEIEESEELSEDEEDELNKNDINEEKEEEKNKIKNIYFDDIESLKIYINEENIIKEKNQYYKNEPFGFIEFKFKNVELNDDENIIKENNIKIVIDDYFEDSKI